MNISDASSIPHSLSGAVEAFLRRVEDEDIVARIWDRDYTVWSPDPSEISNRLGWLDSPSVMPEKFAEIEGLLESVRRDNYVHALLLGMGGSSLAPEVFRRIFGVASGFLDLAVLDSTDPSAVLAHAQRLDPARALFIPATKSGGTVETISFLKYFYNRTAETCGDHAGDHFVAITDPGSGLADLAEELKFRHIFLNDPEIGGRYSALSFFGLVPARLGGIDVVRLVDGAESVARECRFSADNPAVFLGAVMGAAAIAGRDKLTLVASDELAPLGAWVEQLIAESTGKEGKGILPVDGEALLSPDEYGDDRIFAYLRLAGDNTYDGAVDALAEAGHPVVRLELADKYDLGAQFLIWELATAVAGFATGINPFDQPNVEAAKVLARSMTDAYLLDRTLPQSQPALSTRGLAVYGDIAGSSLAEILDDHLSRASDDGGGRGYVALQAYVPPGPDTDEALAVLRLAITRRSRLATTLGYGPRFLHSTGQLHKGDAGLGLFIQFTCDDAEDADIPDVVGSSASSMSFGVLKAAQALGDRQALIDAGRHVIRIHLGSNVPQGLRRVTAALG